MLRLMDLRAGYSGREVLHGITFDFQSGQNYCILGPNGCGKTTLVRAMAALIDSTGTLEIDGRSIRKMKRREIASRIAVMSQVTQIYFPYTVYDTVMLGRYQHLSGRMFGGPGREDREIVEECLASVRLDALRNRRIDELSGGQRQRVAIGRALITKPTVILADEPTGALDRENEENIMKILRAIHENGTALIIVTHDPEIADACDTRIEIDDGRVRTLG